MKISKRARKAGLAAGVAAFATMAIGVSSANAAPVAFANTFDNGFLKTAFPGSGFDVIEPSTPAGGADPPASVAGQLETTTGVVTIPTGCTGAASPGVHNGVGFCFPDFSGTVSGIPITVQLETLEPMVVQATGGIVTPTGGAVAQPTDFLATLDVAGDACIIGDPPGAPDDPDMTLTFSTDDVAFPNPYDGDLFDVPFHTGADYPPLQNGAIAANWPSLPPAQPGAPGDDCALINGLIGSPGGLWIAEGLASPAINQPPATPPPTTGGGIVQTTPPAKKKCKKGQKLKKGKCVKKKKKKKKK